MVSPYAQRRFRHAPHTHEAVAGTCAAAARYRIGLVQLPAAFI
jgi:hypothetical protein